MTAVPPIVVDARRVDIATWKAMVRDLAAREPDRPVRVRFNGGANLITGYRLYYILRYAKRCGLRDVTLESDGGFRNEEAADWLADSGVDRVEINRGG